MLVIQKNTKVSQIHNNIITKVSQKFKKVLQYAGIIVCAGYFHAICVSLTVQMYEGWHDRKFWCRSTRSGLCTCFTPR